MRGATPRWNHPISPPRFQSTLLMRGATDVVIVALAHAVISIHAPHARSDSVVLQLRSQSHYFNPRSSCEERRRSGASHRPDADFNPRSSCEERQIPRRAWPRAVSDFNPRSSCEERPAPLLQWLPDLQISIHAPHARSDASSAAARAAVLPFQSTLLMRGATQGFLCIFDRVLFQSTLLMRGATRPLRLRQAGHGHFNPRSSCEERRRFHQLLIRAILISIHAPHARSDPRKGILDDLVWIISIHAPHARSDL